MIYILLQIIGLTIFLESLLDKYGAFTWIERKGSKSRFKLVYDIAYCRFCQRFHLSWIITFFVWGISGDDYSMSFIIIPSIATGIIQLLKK